MQEPDTLSKPSFHSWLKSFLSFENWFESFSAACTIDNKRLIELTIDAIDELLHREDPTRRSGRKVAREFWVAVNDELGTNQEEDEEILRVWVIASIDEMIRRLAETLKSSPLAQIEKPDKPMNYKLELLRLALDSAIELQERESVA